MVLIHHAQVEEGDLIRDAARRLAEFPASGRPGRVAGSYELVIVGTPYVIVYRVRSTGAINPRLLHGAQRWPPGVAK